MIEPLYRAHAATLRALVYRMTGSVADSEEIAQETFTRALAAPPGTVLGRTWLLAVAANLARDRLRRRKRAAYVGPWLPEAMEAEAEPSAVDPERRYGLRESASFAFLLALEPLTSRQRAVLLLRDVFDLSVEETAEILRMGEGAVRGMHHRARAALAGYDEERSVATRERLGLVRGALEQLAAAVATGDPTRVETVLAEHATLHADGAGRFGAVRQPLRGARTIARFAIFGQQRLSGIPSRQSLLDNVNGAPALLVESRPPPGVDVAPRLVLTCDVDRAGRITKLYALASPEKVARLRPSEGFPLHEVHDQSQADGDGPGERPYPVS
jgi:RNA polymerase sigma-70 factor (ECF subfamily)